MWFNCNEVEKSDIPLDMALKTGGKESDSIQMPKVIHNPVICIYSNYLGQI